MPDIILDRNHHVFDRGSKVEYAIAAGGLGISDILQKMSANPLADSYYRCSRCRDLSRNYPSIVVLQFQQPNGDLRLSADPWFMWD